MANQMIQIHDATTDQIIVREMTDQEQASFDAANALSMEQLEETKASTKTAKEAAQAKLTALGLTADDLKALGLGNN
jgi:hypothetical protein